MQRLSNPRVAYTMAMQRLGQIHWPNSYPPCPYPWPYPWPNPPVYCYSSSAVSTTVSRAQTRSVVTVTKTVYYKCSACGDYTNSPTHICNHCAKKKRDDDNTSDSSNDFEDIALQVYLGQDYSNPPPSFDDDDYDQK